VTANVTPIRPPSDKPPKQRKPRKPPEERIALRFARGNGRDPFDVFMGLRGVCKALERLEGSAEFLDDFMTLSAAASVLADVLVDLEIDAPAGRS
jgi:hypothetical protein